MNNIRTVFFGMLKRLKYALVIALLVGAGSIGLYYCGRPIANVFSVNDKIDIALTDNDKSELSAMLKSYLSDRINMNIIEDGKEKFNDKLINRDVSAIIEIPQDFEKNVIGGKDVKIKSTTLDDYENGAYISVYIEGFMRSVNIAANAAKGDAELFSRIMNSDAADTKLTKENAVISDREDEYVSAGFKFSEGFMIMLVTAIGIFITLAVMEDRQYGTYSRMAVSSVTGVHCRNAWGKHAYIIYGACRFTAVPAYHGRSDDNRLSACVCRRNNLLTVQLGIINNARTADKLKTGSCHAFGLYHLDRRIARRCVVPDRRNGRYAEISVIYHAAILVCLLYVGRG